MTEEGIPGSINTSWNVSAGGYFDDFISSGKFQVFREVQSFTGTANGIPNIPLKVFGFFGAFDANEVYAVPGG